MKRLRLAPAFTLARKSKQNELAVVIIQRAKELGRRYGARSGPRTLCPNTTPGGRSAKVAVLSFVALDMLRKPKR
jgi:hypothetical protein